MAKYDIKYKTGDEIFVAGKIQKAEIINGEIYYKIAEAEELIPQGKVFPKMVRALVNIARGNYSLTGGRIPGIVKPKQPEGISHWPERISDGCQDIQRGQLGQD